MADDGTRPGPSRNFAAALDAAIQAEESLEEGIDPSTDAEDLASEPEAPDEALRNDRQMPKHFDDLFVSILDDISKKRLDLSAGFLWIRRPNTWQSLCKGWTASMQSEIYLPDVFVWVPHLFADVDLKCPKGHKLWSKGSYDNPKARRVLDVDGWFYLMQWRYECRACGKARAPSDAAQPSRDALSWGSGDETILNQLPLGLRAEFKIFLTHRSAVTDSLALLTRQLFASGMGPQNVHSFLTERYKKQYADLELSLLAAFQHRRSLGIMPGRDPFLQISDFDDRQGYNGYIPSSGYLKFIFCELEQKVEKAVTKMMSLMEMDIAKCDHSFKVIARLHCYGGQPYATALYTCVNELEGIRGMRLTVSKSLTHVTGMLKDISKSLQDHGLPPTRVFYTDSARNEETLMSSIFPATKAIQRQDDNNGNEALHEATISSLDTFLVPKSVKISVVNTAATINEACKPIVDAAKDLFADGQKDLVVGFDTEWVASFKSGQGGGKNAKTQIIQVAMEHDDQKLIVIAQVHLY